MVSVRPFQADDALALAAMMVEMTDFYGAKVSPELVVADDIRRQAERIDIIVAVGDEGLLGFATSAPGYPIAGLIPFTYIHQVYVSLKARRLGVAQQLMAAIARSSIAEGIRMIQWSTARENTAARRLYGSLGAAETEKISYTLDGADLDRLANTVARSTT